jgi:hypothetical protein
LRERERERERGDIKRNREGKRKRGKEKVRKKDRMILYTHAYALTHIDNQYACYMLYNYDVAFTSMSLGYRLLFFSTGYYIGLIFF